MAATPIITCPECDKKFKTKRDVRGEKIRCPFCKEMFTVPMDYDEEPEEVDEVAEEAPIPARAAKSTNAKVGAAKAGNAKAPAKRPAKAPPPVPPPPPTPAPMRKPGTDDDDDDEGGPKEYGITELDLAPRCPNCANEMESETAVVCLYCGYNTLLRTWGKTDKVIAHTFGDYLFHLLPGILGVLFIMLSFAGAIYYCLVLPDVKKWYWLSVISDHESTRLWLATFILFCCWASGMYAFNRLVLHTRPPDKLKDKVK